MAGSICETAERMEENIMSLLDVEMTACIMLNKQTTADGYGGYDTTWSDGAEFNAAIVLDTSMQARVGEKQGVTALYTVTTVKAMNLQYHDVFRRVADGKIFRVTSDGDDKRTPKTAGLDMRQVSAEEWTLSQ